MITPLELRWSNMFSYGEGNSLKLNENTVTQIIGVNGNGKSSIPLILEEVIFNKNSKGIKKASIANRYTSGSYSASLDFSKDDDIYTIDIERKTNLKVKLYKNGVDISSHTATATFKTIEDIFGIDHKTFSQLVYQNVNNSLQFLTATDTNRKKFLIEILQLEDYVTLFEVFKEAAREHAVVVSNLQSKVDTIENWIKTNAQTDLTAIELKEIDVDTSADERRVAELSSELTNIKSKNARIAKNNHYRDLLDAIDINELQSVETINEPISYDEEQSELGGLRSELKSHEAHLSKLEKLGDSCPTCEQDIDTTFKSKLLSEEREAITSISTRIGEIESTIQKIKEDNKKYHEKQEQIKNWEELFRAVDRTLPREPIHKEDLETELTNLSIRISNAKENLKALIAHNENAARHNSKIQVLKEQAESFQTELASVSEQVKKEEEHLNLLELLKKSFSTNGLIAYKIENLVKDLEELTNDYLAELSDGRFTIDFSVVSDKLNVNITDNGNVIDIVELSTGELARVNTATLLALRKLMASISKDKISILFLDEVTTVLDDEGKEKLVEVLLKEDLNTYIVSHGWRHPLLARLEIVKEDEISRIEHG
jgi:DNA repair exonuclease SbcCD ATPase subunit